MVSSGQHEVHFEITMCHSGYAQTGYVQVVQGLQHSLGDTISLLTPKFYRPTKLQTYPKLEPSLGIQKPIVSRNVAQE